jgi:hypothetical protein
VGPIAGAQAVHDQVHFLLDGALGIRQFVGDVRSGPALGEKPQDRQVPGRQPVVRGRCLGLVDWFGIDINPGKPGGSADNRSTAMDRPYLV